MGPFGGSCATAKVPNREFWSAIKIFQDGKGINAIQFLPRGDSPVLVTLGKVDTTTNESKAFPFAAGQNVVGFYGLQNTEALGTLGFLYKD